MDKEKFLKDAFDWFINDKKEDIFSEEFTDKLFNIIAPMSNFEIGKEDVEEYREERMKIKLEFIIEMGGVEALTAEEKAHVIRLYPMDNNKEG